MKSRSLYRRIDALEEEIARIAQALPGEPHLQRLLSILEGETTFRLTNLMWPLLLRVLAERGISDPDADAMVAFLEELRREDQDRSPEPEASGLSAPEAAPKPRGADRHRDEAIGIVRMG